MKNRNYKFYIRKSHRYLGIFIGVQFLLWTIGGLYFSWTNIEEIRAEHLRKEQMPDFSQNLVSPQVAIDKIKNTEKDSHIHNLRVIEVGGAPVYEFSVMGTGKKNKLIAADAVTGEIRPPVSEQEAARLATGALVSPLPVKNINYLTEETVGAHHEYRESPLPAWAVTFENDLTVYIAAETGQVRAFRTDKWRVFDFLWMLHTMDFEARDNFNNYILRGFSVLGVVTILSGFLLFFVSSKFVRRIFSSRVPARVNNSE